MQVREIMSSQVEVISPDSPIFDAAKKMKQLDVGSLPVCDGDRLSGMITDRDITVRAVAEGRDPKKTTAKETMTPDVVYAFEDQDYEEAAALMRKRQIRRLPVLNRDKKLVGILSLGDVSDRGDDSGVTAKTVKGISKQTGGQH